MNNGACCLKFSRHSSFMPLDCFNFMLQFSLAHSDKMAKREASNNNLSENRDEIGHFFAKYPQFDYKPREDSWSEYRRMVQTLQWKTGDKKERIARSKFPKAIVGRFNQLYGTDENKLDTLQLLCNKIGISPVWETITSCKAVRRLWL